MIPVDASVETVRSALADHIDLAARRAPETGVVVGDADAELLDAVHADRNDRHLVAAARDDVVGDVDAIQIEGVLVTARTRNCAACITETSAV